MGLDTSHDCWHGPYSAFSRFREALAVAAGYQVGILCESMEPHARRWSAILVDWGHLGIHLHGEWDATPADPLLVLIAHHDDQGQIHPTQAGPLADRIDEVATKIADGPEAIEFRRRAGLFSAGLRRAAAAGESVDFH